MKESTKKRYIKRELNRIDAHLEIMILCLEENEEFNFYREVLIEQIQKSTISIEKLINN